MKNYLLNSLNKAINAYINIDPESRSRLKSLENKVVSIELLPFHYIFQFVVREQGTMLQENEILIPDVTISGTPLQLASLVLAKENRHQFFADDVTIKGNVEVGQQVISLFDELEIDWQEQLSHLIGDVPVHHLDRFIKNAKAWFTRIDESFSADVNEYIHEEISLFPSKEILAQYYHEIDELRMDVDRVEAKIESLKKILREDEA